MTYGDAIEIIKDEIECVNRQFCERQCGLCDLAKESSEILQAYEMAIEAFEKADKYKWHDLRENPEDLPEERDSIFAKYYNTEKWHKSFFRTVSDEVIVCFEAPTGERIEKQVQSHDGQFNFPYTALKKMKAIAWRYIEPFDEVEECQN